MGSIPSPFCDFVNVSAPIGAFEALSEPVIGLVLQAGGYSETEQIARLGGGVIKLDRWGRVGRVSVSGASLAVLRERRLFESLLWEFQAVEHRVTQLHATLDLPSDAPVVLRRIYRSARAGALSFTRKKISGQHCNRIQGPSHYDGRDTGTVYLGKRGRDVWAKVYDKRELILKGVLSETTLEDRAAVIALNDPGPLTRYELCFGRHVGLSLRDVADPSAVFWHHAKQTLLVPPEGVREWVANDIGYVLPERGPTNYAEQLKLLLGNSADVKRAVGLADKLGPHGRQYALSVLDRLYRDGGISSEGS